MNFIVEQDELLVGSQFIQSTLFVVNVALAESESACLDNSLEEQTLSPACHSCVTKLTTHPQGSLVCITAVSDHGAQFCHQKAVSIIGRNSAMQTTIQYITYI